MGKKTQAKVKTSAKTKSDATLSQEDVLFAQWVEQVKVKKEQEALRQKSIRVGYFEKDEEQGKIIRRKSQPIAAGTLVKKLVKTERVKKNLDLEEYQQIWENAVPSEIAQESKVYSYKDGVLTVQVVNSPLLQEIRQFQQQQLFSAVSTHWPKTLPLRTIVYKPGSKKSHG